MIIQGNSFCLPIKDESIDMCLTSPPYWGLRDYGIEQIFGGDRDCEHDFGIIHRRRNDKSGGHQGIFQDRSIAKAQDGARFGPPTKTCSKCQAWEGQLGLEPTPELYIEHLTQIFNEVKRVLKKEGTFWLNMGDTYSGSGGAGGDYNEGGLREGQPRSRQGNTKLQSKCLCMIPERLAWSLIQNGWILRNKIPWIKPNCMPSSVKDRFANRWEYVFLFSKSRRYCFDLDSVREPHAESSVQRVSQNQGNPKFNGNKKRDHPKGQDTLNPKQFVHPLGKNPGDIWTINTTPCPIKGIHFATFPDELCRRAILPGSREGQIVLDPFCGIGTTCFVAQKLKRRFIGIDIKAEYCKKAKNERLAQGVL